jgi:hypothetical protein
MPWINPDVKVSLELATQVLILQLRP